MPEGGEQWVRMNGSPLVSAAALIRMIGNEVRRVSARALGTDVAIVSPFEGLPRRDAVVVSRRVRSIDDTFRSRRVTTMPAIPFHAQRKSSRRRPRTVSNMEQNVDRIVPTPATRAPESRGNASVRRSDRNIDGGRGY